MLDVSNTIDQLEQEGLSVAEIAKKVNVSPDAVYRWKRGVTIPNSINEMRLSSLLPRTEVKVTKIWSVVQVQGLCGTFSEVDILPWQTTFTKLMEAQVAVLEELAQYLDKEPDEITVADFEVEKDQVNGDIFTIKIYNNDADVAFVISYIGVADHD